ncbi:MAG: hypothetical protein VX589_16370 [Myxococcota bacterium]|nr:hypothetical protein [Myxococcota bacterium]
MENPLKELVLGALVLVFLSHSWMYSDITVPNERSRVYLAVAIVDDHTLSIDGPLKRFGPIDDRARIGERYFSDKPPGAGLLAGGVYALVRQFTAASDWSIAHLITLMRCWIMIPIGVLGFIFVRRLLRLYHVDEVWVDLSSIGWMLGSVSFHYSSAFFSHQIVSVCLIVAFFYLKKSCVPADGSPPGRRVLTAGALCGMATLTEYQAVVPCALLTVYLLFSPAQGKARLLGLFLGAAIPFAGALLWYNDTAFGHPLSLSYEHLAHATYRQIHGQGIAGVTWPTLESFKLWYLTPRRGLLFGSPMFVLVPIGLLVLLTRRQWVDGLVLGGIVLFYLLFLSSANIWGGDWGYGPRLAVPALGLFTVAVGIGAQAVGRWPIGRLVVKVFIIWGIVLTQSIHGFFPEPWARAINPISDIVIPMAQADVAAPNLVQKWTQIRGVVSLVPLAFLTGGMACFCLWRGEATWQWKQRIVMALTVCILIAVALYGFSTLPDSGPSSHAKWLRLIRLWQAREAIFE